MASGLQRGDPVLRPLKWYRELSDGKSRALHGYFLVGGSRAVTQVASARPEAIDELLVDERVTALPGGCDGIPVRTLTVAQLSGIASSSHPQGIIAVVRIPPGSYGTVLPSDPGSRIVLLEDLQDPGNVGAMIRIAAAFGFDGVVLSRQSSDPFGPKAVQASAGSLLTPWIRRGDGFLGAVTELKDRGYRLCGADLRGTAGISFSGVSRFAVAFGNEGAGLSGNLLGLLDCRFVIPMLNESVESLNVAAAGAIVLFAAFRNSGW